jgi:hypothetical protein
MPTVTALDSVEDAVRCRGVELIEVARLGTLAEESGGGKAET